ncbi:UvrD-helicase domain-containing protein [Kribbella sp. HUAS MG21]|uniref:UvrD-helicase domain-containing protein n=1 Tax=Kribbella sp. HUAS MG21 TaxID=3160966 RepID=A0AAU7T5S5_9ACTN
MSEPALDDSQLAAVDIPAKTRQIVIAGPGSGKTEVVSALLGHLVDDEDVDPIDGILVISFSNAAVHAIRRRFLMHIGRQPVGVQTLDSLAGEVLRDLSTEDYERLTFDGRIALATRLLAEEGWGRTGDLEHLVVDEVQDVVGVRADFLLAIIGRLPTEAGFTLLGDPAQGIYDFQLRPNRHGQRPRSSTTSPELVNSVAALSGTEIRHLTGQYRAASRETRAAAMLREAVLPGGDPTLLEDFHAAVVPAGTVEDVVEHSGRWQGTTAFLTATNGQALLVAGALRTRTAVEVHRGAQQRVIGAWMARLFGDDSAVTIARRELDALVAERCPELDPAMLWRVLREVQVGKGTEIDLWRLAQRLRGPRPLPPEMIDHPATPYVVSTVHRAKGLEFDNVVLVDFPEHGWLEDSAEPEERLRALFVSLTRARQLIARADGPDDKFVRRLHKPGLHAERWYLGGPKQWMTFGFEIGVADTVPALDSARAQAHLTAEVSIGDSLDLRLDRLRSTLSVPVYTVLHDGVPVAQTSSRFGEDLASRIGSLTDRKASWPTLRGARVESVATVIVDSHHPGSAGRPRFRLIPVITGLLHIDWKESTPDD